MGEERPSSSDARKEIENALSEVESVEHQGVESSDAQAVLKASAAMLQGMNAFLGVTLGECRRNVPFAELRPVLRADGSFQWCCTHEEEHCV